MKTAISIRDDIYKEAEEFARRLGISRSKLYTLAVSEYIHSYAPDSVTAQLNEVYKDVDSSLDEDIAQANYDLFSRDEW